MGWRVTMALVVIVAGTSSGIACDVPVFRYALERWAADLFEVDVFYRGELAPGDRTLISRLEDQAQINGGTVNWEVVLCNADAALAPDLVAVRERLGAVPFPQVALRMPGGRKGSPVVWSGPPGAAQSFLWDTPARQELTRRLLAGDSVVWLVLRGNDGTQSAEVERLLATQLPVLAQEIPLPPGVGRTGSELLSRLPLHMRFSVLAVNAGDDTVLRRIAESQLPEPRTAAESLVLPVFGRGRALAVLSAADVDAAAIEDYSRFLCGACSCQVKEANPGFDLLLAVNWDERLYDGDPPTLEVAGDSGQPLSVAIAPGMPPAERAADERSPPPAAVEVPVRPQDDPHGNGWLHWLALGVAVLLPLLAWFRSTSRSEGLPR